MRFSNDHFVFGFIAVVFIVLLTQVLLPERVPVPTPPAITPCRGEPIATDFAFTGTIHEQWTCKKQCDDREVHYILYSNGKATQCEDLPGCNDFGEDKNITCTPPMKTDRSGA